MGDYPTPEIEALAEALASADGKLDYFEACRRDEEAEKSGGYYGGYLSEADSAIQRLRKRGYMIVKRLPVDGTVS